MSAGRVEECICLATDPKLCEGCPDNPNLDESKPLCETKDCNKNINGVCEAKPLRVDDKGTCRSYGHIPGFERRK